MDLSQIEDGLFQGGMTDVEPPPDLNAHSERFVQTIKSEALDCFLAFGEDHLRLLCSEFLIHYHERRPHQGKEIRAPAGAEPADWTGPVTADAMVFEKRLGGHSEIPPPACRSL